ncbi:MAG TPA: hypothetical protein VHG93_02155 [Longimicrobium sp.]|nr:hypothetical protein [Longimicrobium sp.]
MSKGYDANVFINCPFDDAYQPLFRALVFAIHACGMIARSALELDDGGEARIEKIARLIGECRHGIHDISRTDADTGSALPRMNMPFELGLFLGAKRFGIAEHGAKTCIIFDRERYRYQQFLSDIAGQDVLAHADDPRELIRGVRNALATTLPNRTILPSGRWLTQRYMIFLEDVPTICLELRLDHDDLSHRDLAEVIITWLERNPVNAVGFSTN